MVVVTSVLVVRVRKSNTSGGGAVYVRMSFVVLYVCLLWGGFYGIGMW